MELLEGFLGGIGAVGLLGLLAFLARHLILTRLRASVQHEFNEKLERLKSGLQARESEVGLLRGSVLNLMGSSHALLNQRRSRAIDAIWAGFLSVREKSGIVGTFGILKIDGLYELRNNENFQQLLDGLFPGYGGGGSQLSPIMRVVELEKIYVDDETWGLFYAYYSIVAHDHLRLMTLKAGLNPGELVKTSVIVGALKEAMPEQAAYLDQHGANAFPHLLQPLEAKFLAALRKQLPSGAVDSDATAAARMIHAIAGLQAAQQSETLTVPAGLAAQPAPPPVVSAPKQ